MFQVRKMRRRRAVGWISAAVFLVGSAQPGFAAMMFGVTDGGVVEAAGCTSAACGGSQTFDDTIGTFAAVSGSIMIDMTSDTLDLSLRLDDAFGLLAMGGTDNGVSNIGFSSVLYTVSGLSLIEVVPGSTFIIGGGQTASVSGIYSQDAAASGFGLGAARITGSCNVVGEAVTCGLGFGTTDFTLGVGATPQSRFFRHTMNVTGVVPEPSTALLLATGLVGLALRRRR